MSVSRRTRDIAADPEDVWRIVGDPSHLPRWWPKVQRVEGVVESAFTKVFLTSKGRTVRADFVVAEFDAPRTRRWALIVEDSPFAGILRSSEEVATVAPREGGARVTLELRQRLRGISRLGAPMVRRAGHRQLDEALDALERLL